jgi:acyl carrier protein
MVIKAVLHGLSCDLPLEWQRAEEAPDGDGVPGLTSGVLITYMARATSASQITVRDRRLAGKTGYPADMLDAGMVMESDLGIDSIKRVEILGVFRDKYPESVAIGPEQLAELRTLDDVVSLIAGSPARMAIDLDGGEAGGAAPLGEELGLVLGPAVAGVPGRARLGLALDSEEAARGTEHPPDLPPAGVEVTPVVDGRQRPDDGGRAVGQRQRLGRPLPVAHGRPVAAARPGQGAAEAQHHGRRVDAGDRRHQRAATRRTATPGPSQLLDFLVAGRD